MTDTHAEAGAPLGSVGWIVEVYDDAYEVEVVRADGTSQFLGAVRDQELTPLEE